MDPLITGALVGGAAGKFVEKLSEKGVDWLIGLVAAQSPAAQEQIKRNSENFLGHLSKRVERLEHEVTASNRREIFDDALAHPSSSLMLKKVMTSAAATDSETRHNVLSELIAQRLQSGAEDMIALAGNAACDVVLSLSVRQINLLAVLASVQSIGPTRKLKVATPELATEVFVDWCKKNLHPFYSVADLKNITPLDFDHLVALSCLSMSIGSKDILKIMRSKLLENVEERSGDPTNIESLGWPEGFFQMWQHHGAHASLTSIGTLIGVLHRDAVLKSQTLIQW